MEVIDNKEKQRFEVKIEEEYAYSDYRWNEGKLVIMHTFVPESLRGKGLADMLAHHILEFVKSGNLKAIVYCPFVRSYVKRHPEYLPWTNL